MFCVSFCLIFVRSRRLYVVVGVAPRCDDCFFLCVDFRSLSLSLFFVVVLVCVCVCVSSVYVWLFPDGSVEYVNRSCQRSTLFRMRGRRCDRAFLLVLRLPVVLQVCVCVCECVYVC